MPAYDDDDFDWTGTFGPGGPFGGGGGPGEYFDNPPVTISDPPPLTSDTDEWTPPPADDPSFDTGGFWSGLEKALGLGAGALKSMFSGPGGTGPGGLTLKDILAMLAGTGGTLYNNKMTKEGVEAIHKATGESKDLASAAMAKVSGNYKPFMDTGVKSNADLYAMVGNSNLSGKFDQNAPKFNPLTSYVGGVSLADLAQYRR